MPDHDESDQDHDHVSVRALASTHARTQDLARRSFATVYRQHVAFVRRRLRSLGVPEAALDDATQEVFLVLHRRAADYDGRRLSSWLAGIARGVASTHRRSRRRLARLRGQMGEVAVVGRRAADERTCIDAVGVSRVVDELDDASYRLFVASELLGHDGRTMAGTFGVNLNTLYARVRSLRRRIALAVERCRVGKASLGGAFLWWWAGQRSARAAIRGSLTAAAAVVAPIVVVTAQPDPRADSLSTRVDGHHTPPPLVSDGDTSSAVTRSGRAGQRRFRGPESVGLRSETIDMTITTLPTIGLALAMQSPAAAVTSSPTPTVLRAASTSHDTDELADRGRQAGARRYVFDDDDLEGDVLTPDHEALRAIRSVSHISLITLRRSFDDRLLMMSEDI